MTKLSNAIVAADAPWGTIIGTFDADLKQLQSNPFGYFGIIEKRKLCTAWNGQAIPGEYEIGAHGSGEPEQFIITVAAVSSTLPAPPPPPPEPAPPPLSHDVIIGMAEDAYQGDAQFSVAVDGKEVAGGTITTLRSSGNSQDILVIVPDGTHTITVTFLNDAWGGTYETDRNLWINYIKYDGAAVWSEPTALMSTGDKLSVSVPTTASPTTTSLSHDVVIGMAEDVYQGDAQYSVAVDGTDVAHGTITTLRSSGNSQDISVTVPDGTHTITVTFLNDAWGGTYETDRNLWVNYIKYDGAPVWSAPVGLGTPNAKFAVTVPPLPLQPTAITLTPVALSIQDNAPAGTVIATASVVMSDGSQFTGALTSSDPFFAISGMNIVTSRALTVADDGQHNTTITAHQGNQNISARLMA